MYLGKDWVNYLAVTELRKWFIFDEKRTAEIERR